MQVVILKMFIIRDFICYLIKSSLFHIYNIADEEHVIPFYYYFWLVLLHVLSSIYGFFEGSSKPVV